MDVIRRVFSGRFRWLIAGLIFLAITINYIDRQIIALLKPALDREMHWSNESFGYVNSAFFGAYALSYLLFGWLIDRVGVKIGLAISIAWWSIAACCHAFAHSVRGFIFARLALGIGEGGAFPSAVKTTAHWFPASERALAASIFNCGANMGPILAPAIIPWIADVYGWRMAFIAAGACGLAWLLFWLPLYTNMPADNDLVARSEVDWIDPHSSARDSRQGKLSWLDLLSHRETWAIIVARFLTDPVSWFFLIWLPDFFKRTRGLELKQSWIHLVSIYATATLVALAAGWIAGRLLRSGMTVTRSRKLAMLIFAFSVLPICVVPGATDWQAVLLIGVAVGSHHGWSAILYASVSDLFPKAAVGLVTGMAGLAGAVGGMIFPPVVGRLLDNYSVGVDRGAFAYSIVFGACSSAYLIAFILNHLLAPRFQQIQSATT